MIDKNKKALERVVLVGVITNTQNEEQVDEFLKELAFLTLTAGGEAIKQFTQKLDKPNPKT